MASDIKWDTHSRINERTTVRQVVSKRSEEYCRCGTKAVYFRRYEGGYYCKKCLIHQVEKRFRKTVVDNGLVGKGDRIAVGFSGSKDSSVLLALMHKYFSNIAELIAVTIDEGISGYRDRSIEVAEKFAKQIGVEHKIFSFRDTLDIEIDELKTGNYCTFCGVFRRRLLNKAALQLDADKLAIGHNLDDEIQSIMMNVIRGDFVGLKRLGAIGIEEFVRRIKPLRDIPEKEIKLYAILSGINFYDGECPHSLNNVRRDVQKIINDLEEKYPGTKMQIMGFYSKMKEPAAEKELLICSSCGTASSSEICKPCELFGKMKSTHNH